MINIIIVKMDIIPRIIGHVGAIKNSNPHNTITLNIWVVSSKTFDFAAVNIPQPHATKYKTIVARNNPISLLRSPIWNGLKNSNPINSVTNSTTKQINSDCFVLVFVFMTVIVF